VWGSGPQTDKNLPQIPLTDKFLEMATFWIAFYESYLATRPPYNSAFTGKRKPPLSNITLITVVKEQTHEIQEKCFT
jgi:hypothetical protein